MNLSDIPYKFVFVWGQNASARFVTDPIPATTVSGIAASQSLGFPPATAVATGAGGTPPDIDDFNGAYNYLSRWAQWQQAGGPVGYDATFQTDIGGYPSGARLNAASGYGQWLSLVDNNVTDPDTGGAGWTSALPAGQPQSSGLVAQNNSGTPATHFDISANFATFRTSPTGAALNVSAISTVTNNILTAGPAANGRDQAGAFTASSWVHFYLIYNNTTVATLSSAVAPTTGPILPTGYVGWAYVGAVFLSAGSALASVRIRGCWVTYDTPVSGFGGSATTPTAVSLVSAIPPNALEYELQVSNLALTASGSGAYALTLFLETVGSAGTYQCGLNGAGVASAVTGVSGGAVKLPNIGQQFFYHMNLAAGSGPTTTISAFGYSVPNGGE